MYFRPGDRAIMLHCHAGCEPAEIIAALGLSWDDVYYEPRRGRGRDRPPVRPVSERERAVQGLQRAVRIINMASEQKTEPPSTPASALWVSEQDAADEADEHFARVRARHAELACNGKYVLEAMRTPPWKRSYEQAAVLVHDGEDRGEEARHVRQVQREVQRWLSARDAPSALTVEDMRSMRARKWSRCPYCLLMVSIGQRITETPDGWAHDRCVIEERRRLSA